MNENGNNEFDGRYITWSEMSNMVYEYWDKLRDMLGPLIDYRLSRAYGASPARIKVMQPILHDRLNGAPKSNFISTRLTDNEFEMMENCLEFDEDIASFLRKAIMKEILDREELKTT